jgi:hypothetical protein
MGNTGDIYLYLDRDQCVSFQVPYFEEGKLQVAADALLRSKDYDSFHRGILEPLGVSGIYLTRVEKNHPGWYLLTGYKIDTSGGVSRANA